MTTYVPQSFIGLQPSGGDDTAAAQAALSSGSLHFAAGAFLLSAALAVPNNAVITAAPGALVGITSNSGTGLIVEQLGNAAPVTGTWAVGDRIEQSVPAVGQPKGWRCTVAGSPGTWVSEGNL